MIKIIKRMRFIMENNFGLFWVLRILELAIIIRAAIRILKIINVEDIVSIADIDVVEKLVKFSWVRLISAKIVIRNNEAMVIHQ